MNPPTDAEERALRRSRAKNLRERADALARANAGLFAQIHDIDTDMVHVRVSKIGLLPERTPSGRPKNGKKLGTKRDTHGMIETIADALQGVVYPNDRQVDAGTWEKQR